MLIDTHCHLTSEPLVGQIDAVLQRAAHAGVQRMLTVATDAADARAALALLQRFPKLGLIAGVHPHEAGKCTADELAHILALHRGIGLPAELRPRLVALGEIGLDFHYDFATPARQEEVFRAQLELAVDVGRPVVIHARKSEQRVCDVLGDYPALRGRVVFHCFSGDRSVARRILDAGNWLSFTGVITFKNADALRDVLQFVPVERVMLETDAPYLSPEPVRNVRPNEPGLLLHTARRMADIRNEPLEALAARTSANADRFFGLWESNA